jgi:rod shape-determining protein MreC
MSRYRNLSILVVVLFAQVFGLALQVRKSGSGGSTSLIRYWAISTITPMEKAVIRSGHVVSNGWHSYIDLRGVRTENQELKDELERVRLDQVRIVEDAAQARRLQALLAFKEQFISQTVAAQVIGTSGTEQSRLVYIDKGSNDGLKPDMAVLTPSGVVGKVLHVFPSTSQVLLINDANSGVGAILEKSRLQAVLKGTPAGDLQLSNIMLDERIEPGETVLTSGGDRIFPKGLRLGTVAQVTPGSDLFLTIRVQPAAQLMRLEEVLVITKIVEKQQENTEPVGPVRAADLLARRLPTVEIGTPTIEGGHPSKTAPPPPTALLYANKPGDKTAAPPPTSALYGTKTASAPTAKGTKEAAGTAGRVAAPATTTATPAGTTTAPSVVAAKPKAKKPAQPASVAGGFGRTSGTEVRSTNDEGRSAEGTAPTSSQGAVQAVEPAKSADQDRSSAESSQPKVTKPSEAGSAETGASAGGSAPGQQSTTETNTPAVSNPTPKKPVSSDKPQPNPATAPAPTSGGPDGGRRR